MWQWGIVIHSSPIYTLFLNRSGVIQKPVFRPTQLLVAVLLLIKYRFWERGGERICVWPQIRNLSDYNRIRIHNHLVRKWTLNHSVKLIKWSTLWVCICMVHLTVCSYHVTYAFQSESKLNSCVHVKELLAQNRRNIWSLSDWNGIWIPNHLVINELMSYVVNTYLYHTFDCMFSPYHACVIWVHLHCIIAWISRKYLLESGTIYKV